MIMIDLSTLSNTEIYKLKENGVAYWQMINSLADEKILARQKELEGLKAKHTQDESKRLTETNTPSPGYADLAKFMFQNPYDEEILKVEKELHDNLIKALKNDRIIALGYDVPRKANARPVNIPADIIEFKKQTIFNMFSMRNTFQKGSLKVEEVCFIWRRFVDEALKRAENPEPQKLIIETPPGRNKAGRPSTEEITQKAYAECRELGLIDFTKFKKDAVFIVLSHIKNNHLQEFGDGKGFDDRTVLKHISKEFDANKLKYKVL